MLAINQFDLTPGVYEHYKGGLYVVRTVITHVRVEYNGEWERMQDPWVAYEHLEPQYESINGSEKKMVQRAYLRKLSDFTSDVEIEGKIMKRFKLV